MGNWTPQRFARTVAERQRKSGDGDGLMLWLSSDAMARLRVGGTGRGIGYIEDLSAYLGALEELVEEHGALYVGLGDPIGGFDGTYDRDVKLLTALGRERRNRVVEPVLRAMARGDLSEPLADLTAYELQVSRGAGAFGDEDGLVGVWFTGSQEEIAHDMPIGELAELVAAAVTLYTRPQDRDDAAMELEPRTVEVKRRRGTPKRNVDVSVIDVRRPAHGVRQDGEQGRVEHDHRWVTRGHWRNQPYGKGRALRHRVWIEEHVCGPEDKPIRRAPKVYRVA